MTRTVSSSILLVLSAILISLSITACFEETSMLPDAGPPPPPPIVTADSATLHQLGKSIEKWTAEGDTLSLARLIDLKTLMERIYYPDSLTGSERKRVDATLDDSQHYRELAVQFWKTAIDHVREGGTMKFLRVSLEGRSASLIFRAMQPDESLDYVELLVGENQQNNPVFCDVRGFIEGEYTSRMAYRFAKADDRSNLEKLFDINDQAEKVMEIANEATALSEAGSPEEALELLKNIPEPYQQMRAIQAAMLEVKREVYDEKTYQKSIRIFVEKFNDEPGIDLLLVDMYGLAGSYQNALEAINRLDAVVHDPYLDTWRANVHLALGNIEEAEHRARAVLTYDSSLIQPNRILFLITALQKNYSEAAQSLKRLIGLHAVWPDLIEQLGDPAFGNFMYSSEFDELKPLIEHLAKPGEK